MQVSDAQDPPSFDEPSSPRVVQDPFNETLPGATPGQAQRPAPVGNGRSGIQARRAVVHLSHRGNPPVTGPPPTNFGVLVGRVPFEDGTRH